MYSSSLTTLAYVYISQEKTMAPNVSNIIAQENSTPSDIQERNEQTNTKDNDKDNSVIP